VGREVRREAPEMVILKYWTPLMAPCFGTICRLARKNGKTKVIVHLDNITPHEPHFYDRALNRYFLSSCDGFIYMSEAVNRDLRTYLPGDILPKADVSSMANALELRSPFLDTAVVEFAARLPMKYKLNAKRRKYILCAAFPEFITPELLNRPKRGFGAPMAAWLRDTWKEQAYDKLFNRRLTADGFINNDTLKKYWDLHQQGRDFSYLLWNLIVFAFFLERRG
jgi:asparagine synthetase B (glutamine-hydrolysing)